LRYRRPLSRNNHCAALSFLITQTQRALRLAATSLYRRTDTTVEPTKEEVTIKMDGCIDSDRVVSSTKKLPSRSAKKMVSYFAKSDSELESDENGDKAPKKRRFKKKANATNNDKFKLAPTQHPPSRTFLGRASLHNRTPRAHSHQTKRPPSHTFSGRARTHDHTPRAHLHQSPICLRGRRNRGHRNAN
jgi:hypothetical protein